ncbi:hypothetical protein QU755_19740 [Pseudomonas wenzhouensis]|nr:hypothetical protein [Pseudomonas wenzhouensis]MDM9653623.1 hypothetical protein [Pseudomonas wenzhouensis]
MSHLYKACLPVLPGSCRDGSANLRLAGCDPWSLEEQEELTLSCTLCGASERLNRDELAIELFVFQGIESCIARTPQAAQARRHAGYSTRSFTRQCA